MRLILTVDINDPDSDKLTEAYDTVKKSLAYAFPSADIGVGLVAADSRAHTDIDFTADVSINAKWLI